MRPLHAFILPFLFASAALAQTPGKISRTLRDFDFEERKLGNPEELPMHWAKVAGPAFPHYVNGYLTTDHARSGKYSFRMDLDGGSCQYRYEPGQLPVRPGAHYRIDGYVQTTPLTHARAQLAAYFVDQDDHPLKGATPQLSPPIVTADGEWRKVSLELTADDPHAAFLVLEMGLLQPAQYAPASLGQRTLFTQDIHGTAWFDDITVSQVPRVSMTTDRPGNIFRRSDPVRLSVIVNDRFTDDLSAFLVVRDALGKAVYQRSGALDVAAAEDLGPGKKRATLDLPDLPPGWYAASLVMSSAGQPVGDQTTALVRLADDAPRTVPDPRVGLIATDLPADGWRELPDLLPYLNVGRVKLAVWSDRGDAQQLDSDGFDRLLERLRAVNVTPTAVLLSLPPAIQEKIGSGAWTQILKAPPELWRPQLAYLISRHATHLDRWQLGADGSDAFVTDPQMRAVYARVYKEFADLIQKPDLAMPWPAWYDLDPALPETIALAVPPTVLPQNLPLYVQDARKPEATSPTGGGSTTAPTHTLSLSLTALDRDAYGRDVQISDLAQRFVYALAAGADRIDLPLPFTTRLDGDTLVKEPQELLLVLRTLTTTLAGAAFKGEMPAADNVTAFLFDRQGQGILILWDKSVSGATSTGPRQVTLDTGDRPTLLDLSGNATPLIPKNGAVAFPLGPTPVFLLDIDAQLAQLRASIAFDRPLLESAFEPHTRRIRFTNPYKTAISGSFKLKAPKGWTITPPTWTFSLNPGETFDRDLTIEFPYNSFAGPKTITAEFQVQADRNSSFTVPITVKLGLSDVGMQSLAFQDGKDIVVQQLITNYGDKPINYTAFAIYPGQARQERLVTNLGPGHTTIKKYRFPPADSAPTSKVRVGVKELDGSRILNQEVAIQ